MSKEQQNKLVPEGTYKAVITGVRDLGIVQGERRYRVTFDVDSKPKRVLTKDLNEEEMRALKRELL